MVPKVSAYEIFWISWDYDDRIPVHSEGLFDSRDALMLRCEGG
jgi:hypothetical protein